MGRGIGRIQEKILSVLEELTRRNKRDWFSLSFVTVFLYTPWQLDPTHERNRGRIKPFVLNWNCGQNERRRVWESVRMLEKRGLVQTRIEKIKGSGIEARFGGIQLWLEVRVV
jgi:hypothetical protein